MEEWIWSCILRDMIWICITGNFVHLMEIADSLEKILMLEKISIIWRQKKRGSEDEMNRWHHRFNGCKLGQTLRDGEGQGSLVCCSSWGRKELDMTERLNNNIWADEPLNDLLCLFTAHWRTEARWYQVCLRVRSLRLFLLALPSSLRRASTPNNFRFCFLLRQRPVCTQHLIKEVQF